MIAALALAKINQKHKKAQRFTSATAHFPSEQPRISYTHLLPPGQKSPMGNSEIQTKAQLSRHTEIYKSNASEFIQKVVVVTRQFKKPPPGTSAAAARDEAAHLDACASAAKPRAAERTPRKPTTAHTASPSSPPPPLPITNLTSHSSIHLPQSTPPSPPIPTAIFSRSAAASPPIG